MMITTIYFWKNNQVHIYQGDNDPDSIRDTNFTNCYAVDCGYEITTMRYGKYFKRDWKPVPLEEFPKAFRTHLLLLGIT